MKAIAVTNWLTPEEKDTERDATTCCLVCGEPALDRQALSVHMFRTHGLRRAIRSYVEGLECLVCGLRFQSRQRIIDHLAEKSQACSHNYLLRYDPLPQVQVQALDLAGRHEFSRRVRLEGSHGVRIHGPFLKVFDLEGNLSVARNGHPLGPNRRWNG